VVNINSLAVQNFDDLNAEELKQAVLDRVRGVLLESNIDIGRDTHVRIGTLRGEPLEITQKDIIRPIAGEIAETLRKTVNTATPAHNFERSSLHSSRHSSQHSSKHGSDNNSPNKAGAPGKTK
jgi:hypothetical protein